MMIWKPKGGFGKTSSMTNNILIQQALGKQRSRTQRKKRSKAKKKAK